MITGNAHRDCLFPHWTTFILLAPIPGERNQIRTGDFLHVVASRRHTQIYKPSSIRLGLVGRGAADPFAVE